MENQKGYIVGIIDTFLDGIWKGEDENGDSIPVIYPTLEDAWKKVADTQIDHLKQFIDGERSYEETDFNCQDDVAMIVVKNNKFHIFDTDGHGLFSISLDDWRKNL